MIIYGLYKMYEVQKRVLVMDLALGSELLRFFTELFGIANAYNSIKNKMFLKKNSHYFDKYHKHLTIYKNGTGIIINSFDIVFNRHVKEDLKRAINISDGKKDAGFPTLKEMQKTKLEDRFHEYGFWMKSEDNIISYAKEQYWCDTDSSYEDTNLKKDNKELRWIFHFNYSRIQNKRKYHVVYVMSIPGMFPITNGKLDLQSANDYNIIENTEIGNCSSMKIRNMINEFKYTVSFENGIEVDSPPECDEFTVSDKKIKQKLELDDNILYNKYTCYIKKPSIGSRIKIKWNFMV